MQRLKRVSAKGRLRVVQPVQKSGQTDATDIIESLERLKERAQGMALMIEADEQHKSFELEFGHDFYSSVRLFEIAMIKRALELADGSQTRAAKLLKLKVTTLNSKIKRYKI
jgi:transcriptional regulator with GAF, ATPase, and Fis domain